jgi:hypothetical protein
MLRKLFALGMAGAMLLLSAACQPLDAVASSDSLVRIKG